jgi:hypothetical protein
MEIKITCDCGQKYVFDVEPEGGQMPVPVYCPACGADGTQSANEILAQVLPGQPVQPVLTTAAFPPAATGAGSIRINLPAGAAAAPKAKASGEFNLGRGIGGALLGAGLGAGLMFGFFALVGFRFPLMGTGIGLLCGFGARLLGRADTTLGVVSAAIALVANGGTLYLMFGNFDVVYVISLVVGAGFAYRIAAGKSH